ncbi:MAG TPA: ATP synthase F1 subunit delta [Chitinophagales bacterium]|nr:ATP synthase F1 subunit delta [Chitinophagales bacterium]
MSATRLAFRYAKSLIDLAIEKNRLEQVYDDILEFDKALQSRDLLLFIKSPIIKSDKKLSVIKAIFKDQFEPITTGFINLIVTKHREFYLPEIVYAFKEQYKELNKIATAVLTTAVPVNDQLLDKVREIVLKQTGKQWVELTTKVDPDILGGFVLTFDDKQFDCSIADKFRAFNQEFQENKYVRKF